MNWTELFSAISGILIIVYAIYRGTKKIKCACLTVEFDHNGDPVGDLNSVQTLVAKITPRSVRIKPRGASFAASAAAPPSRGAEPASVTRW